MEYTRSIKSWAEDDRPREKMLHKGKNALSDAELIAIIIGSGTPHRSALDLAQELLLHSNNDLQYFCKMNIHEYKKIKGIGNAKAITLAAAIELGRRRKFSYDSDRTRVTSSHIAYKLFKPDFQDLLHEEFHALYLNRANYVVQKKQISKGGMTETIADGRIIFKSALELNASEIILAHNHPSGTLFPSEQDKQLTKRLKEFGKLIDIKIVDHLIISDQGFYSFADEGIMP